MYAVCRESRGEIKVPSGGVFLIGGASQRAGFVHNASFSSFPDASSDTGVPTSLDAPTRGQVKIAAYVLLDCIPFP
jgi:hypothetical protein